MNAMPSKPACPPARTWFSAGLDVTFIVIAAAIRIEVFVLLWQFFVVPFGLPALTFQSAFGLLLVNMFLRQGKADDEITTQHAIIRSLSNSTFILTTALLLGWSKWH